MLEGLVVAQISAQGPLEGHHRSKETIMCRTSAQDLGCLGAMEQRTGLRAGRGAEFTAN
jgi:hypothetical protein